MRHSIVEVSESCSVFLWFGSVILAEKTDKEDAEVGVMFGMNRKRAGEGDDDPCV